MPLHPQTLTEDDHRGIHGAEREVPIAGHQLGDAEPVTGGHRLYGEVPSGQVAQEPDLRLCSQACAHQVDDLGDDPTRAAGIGG